MGFGDKATDWQVCSILSIAGGAVLAAGDYVFDFYSDTAAVGARFKFYGIGLGAGGNLSGSVLPATLGPFGPWSGITCDREFCVWDLNGSWGRLTSLTVGMGVVFGPCMITAAKPFLKSWFHSQNVGGFGTGGAGASGEVIIGRWHLVGLSGNRPGADSGADVA